MTVTSTWLKERAHPLVHYNSSNPVPPNAFQQWVVKLSLIAKRWEQVAFDVTDPREALTENLRRAIRHEADPVLILVVSVMDIVSSRCIFRSSTGDWNEINQLAGQPPSTRVPEAVLNLILYGLSDTLKHEGLPVVYDGLQDLLGREDPVLADLWSTDSIEHEALIQDLRENDYDLYEFTRQPVGLALAELLLATHHSVAALNDRGFPETASFGEQLKRQQMMLLTRSMLSSANVVSTGLYGWNPTEHTTAEFAAMTTRMLTVMRAVHERDPKAPSKLAKGCQFIATDLFH